MSNVAFSNLLALAKRPDLSSINLADIKLKPDSLRERNYSAGIRRLDQEGVTKTILAIFDNFETTFAKPEKTLSELNFDSLNSLFSKMSQTYTNKAAQKNLTEAQMKMGKLFSVYSNLKELSIERPETTDNNKNRALTVKLKLIKNLFDIVKGYSKEGEIKKIKIDSRSLKEVFVDKNEFTNPSGVAERIHNLFFGNDDLPKIKIKYFQKQEISKFLNKLAFFYGRNTDAGKMLEGTAEKLTHNPELFSLDELSDDEENLDYGQRAENANDEILIADFEEINTSSTTPIDYALQLKNLCLLAEKSQSKISNTPPISHWIINPETLEIKGYSPNLSKDVKHCVAESIYKLSKSENFISLIETDIGALWNLSVFVNLLLNTYEGKSLDKDKLGVVGSFLKGCVIANEEKEQELSSESSSNSGSNESIPEIDVTSLEIKKELSYNELYTNLLDVAIKYQFDTEGFKQVILDPDTFLVIGSSTTAQIDHETLSRNVLALANNLSEVTHPMTKKELDIIWSFVATKLNAKLVSRDYLKAGLIINEKCNELANQ